MLERLTAQRELPEGEAFPEFLLALVEERLRLRHDHARQFADVLLEIADLPPFLLALRRAYCERVRSRER